jgi:hypothetical protein
MVKAHLTLKGWNNPFVSHTKYLGVMFLSKYYMENAHKMMEAKAFRTFLHVSSLPRR